MVKISCTEESFMTDYRLLLEQLETFCRAEPFYVPLFANASALLWQALPEINWAGFYILRGDALVLGPFQGKPACIRIGPGRGVCGAAVRDGRVLRVADVHAFPGHIACDSASNAEIVLPLRCQGAPRAVLDLDSPVRDRFTEADEAGLRAFAALLEQYAVYE
jgi:L-methionine (R)-S-oxide reductase